MGQINGKQIQNTNRQYFQRQIEIYRWRADSAFNAHIPRVKFHSKTALLYQSQLQHLLQDQLNSLNYVDIHSISKLHQHTDFTDQEQIMTFQPFLTTLDNLQDCLSLQETLYVMQALLSGYQSIFYQLKSLSVSSDCCFLNEKGEVRAWINRNPILNEFPHLYSEVNQASAINQIAKICNEVSTKKPSFLHFSRQLKFFTDRDMY